MKKILLLFLLNVSFCFSSNYKYEISACAFFKDEARYLKEWIEFHKLVGIEHFYLINHFSSDDYKTVLNPYIEKGEVEMFNCPDAFFSASRFMGEIQPKWYTKIIKLAEGKTKWLAILDVDEFLFPVEKDNLQDFLKDYEQFGGVYVFWQMFGTSNVEKIPAGKLQIEMLIWQSEVDYFFNKWGKSIIRPERVFDSEIHFCRYKEPYYHVFPDKTRIKAFEDFELNHYTFIPTFTVDVSKARINHYWTRDEEFAYSTKLSRYETWMGKQEFFSRLPFLDIKPNYEIFKYIDRLKKIIH